MSESSSADLSSPRQLAEMVITSEIFCNRSLTVRSEDSEGNRMLTCTDVNQGDHKDFQAMTHVRCWAQGLLHRLDFSERLDFDAHVLYHVECFAAFGLKGI